MRFIFDGAIYNEYQLQNVKWEMDATSTGAWHIYGYPKLDSDEDRILLKTVDTEDKAKAYVNDLGLKMIEVGLSIHDMRTVGE